MDVTTPEQAQHRRGRQPRPLWRSRAHPRRYPRGRRRFPHERPAMIKGIQAAVYPHHGEMPHRALAEAQILQAIDIDYIDESEVLAG